MRVLCKSNTLLLLGLVSGTHVFGLEEALEAGTVAVQSLAADLARAGVDEERVAHLEVMEGCVWERDRRTPKKKGERACERRPEQGPSPRREMR